MFEVLNELPLATAVSSVYYAIRLLRHGRLSPSGAFEFPDFDLGDLKSEPTPEEKQIGLGLIQEIGEKEHFAVGDDIRNGHSPARGVSDDQVRLYCQELSQAILDRVKPTTETARRRAQQILDELRRSYSAPTARR